MLFLELPEKVYNHRHPHSDKVILADQVGFLTNNFGVQKTFVLKTKYFKVTCNAVKEIFYRGTLAWRFSYFGSEGLYHNLQWIGSGGIFRLYTGLWKFLSEYGVRHHPAEIPKSNLGLENLLVGFQLYLIFDGLAVLSFFSRNRFPQASTLP